MYTRSPPGRRVDGITGVERLDRQVELRARTSITPHLSRERLLCPHQSECLPCSHHELVYSCVLDVPFVWPRGRGDRREVEACSPLEGQGTQLLAPRESRFQAEREKLGVTLGGFWCL